MHRFRTLLRKKKIDTEMAEEMRLHVEHLTQRAIADGMSPDDARNAALRRFGGVAQFQEACRDERGWGWLEHFLRDLRFSLRMLGKKPGFTIAAVLTLALGVGFVTTMFTMVNGIAFRGLPFEEGDRIVSIAIPSDQISHYASQQTSCETMSVVSSSPLNVAGEVVASRQPGAFVSANFFDLLRVQPTLGRGFLPSDATPGAGKVAVISEAFWQQDFQRDPQIIGRELRINREPHTIIGVMAGPFAFPRNEAIWIPLEENAPASGGLVVGRLKQGVSPGRAAEEFTVLATRWMPVVSEGAQRSAAVEVLPFARRGVKDAVRHLLTAILGATFLVLILACANVANLILARACERGRELAVRSALGATRARLIFQMLTETLVLCALGAVVGGWIAQWSTRIIWNYTTGEKELTGGIPYWVNFEMDGRVLIFVIAVTVLACLLTGLVPALQSSRTDLSERLKDGGGSGNLQLSRVTRILVNVQMALSVCLVVAAGLFVTLLIEFNQKNLSYDPTRVLSARVSVNEKDYPTVAQRATLLTELLSQLSAAPEVEAAAVVASESLRAVERRIEIEGETYARSSAKPAALTDSVSPGFFDTLRLELREGRRFQPSDNLEAPAVAVVNTVFASKFGGEQGMVGRRFRIASTDGLNPWISVIGVVSDAGSMKAGRQTDGPLFYRSILQEPASGVTFLVRGRGDAGALGEVVRRTIARRDRELPVNKVYPVQHIIEMERIGINLPGTLLVICGLSALALASIGVYGVISFSVKTRTRELGVRIALGATRRDILRLIVGQGLRQIALGLGAGVVSALGVSAVLGSLFTGFGRSSYDIGIYLGVVALLAGVATAALLIPALRATRVDPLIALRAE